MPPVLCWTCSVPVGRICLFATPIATGTQQRAAGDRWIVGPGEEIMLVMATMSDQMRSKPSMRALGPDLT